MNKLTSKCNGCSSRQPYWEYIDGTKKYQCVEIVCKRQGRNMYEMTKEDAIHILVDVKKNNPFLHTWEEIEKALHMATEALSERTGEWILECDGEDEGDNLYRCFECGCKYGCQEHDKPNFCLDCGARMNKGD